jgi:hypothetical protein
MGNGGKGSRPRPFGVNKKTFDVNWDNIFKTPKERDDAIALDEAFKHAEICTQRKYSANNDHNYVKQN